MTKIEAKTIPSPVGENKPRLDAREKAVGAAIFADDIQFGNKMLHARIKRSPHPHARIKKIDVAKARALPGVKTVVTGEDFPGYIGLYLQDPVGGAYSGVWVYLDVGWRTPWGRGPRPRGSDGRRRRR